MRSKTDMLTGSPFKSLLLFALPMVLGNVMQQLYNIVDSIIVGKFVGQNALASVGSTSTILFIYLAVSLGLAIGCMIIFSQLYGAKNYARMKTAMYTCIIFLGALSLIFLAVGLLSADGILKLTNVQDILLKDAKDYYTIYVVGFPAMFIYNAASQIFNSLGKSRYSMWMLAGSSVLNVVLDTWFVLPEGRILDLKIFKLYGGLGWGVKGAAIATDISQYVVAIAGLIWALVYLNRKFKSQEKSRIFDFPLLGNMLKVAVPTMLAQVIVSVGYAVLMSLVNKYSVDIISGYVSGYRIDSLCGIPMIQIGNAIATYTGQNVGAKQFDRIPKGIRSAAVMCVIVWIFFMLLVFLAGHWLIGLFMDENAAEAAYQAGVGYMRVMSSMYILLGLMYVFSAALRGAGDIVMSVVAVTLNFGVRCAFAFIVADGILHVAEGSEIWIWWSNPIGWFVALVICVLRYRTGIWKTKRLADKV